MNTKPRGNKRAGQCGFSMLELIMVVSILIIVASLALPNILRGVRTANFHDAVNDVGGVLQQARIRAVQDDRYYSVYYLDVNKTQFEFADIYPQNVNGASGTGGSGTGSGTDPQDPVVTLAREVSPQLATSAPNTQNLQSQVLPSNPYNIAMVDGYATGTPVTFGPEGLPCKPRLISGGSGGTVCTPYNNGPQSGAAAATAYWLFFEDIQTQAWEAVTVSPAGRILKWTYDGTSTWNKM